MSKRTRSKNNLGASRSTVEGLEQRLLFSSTNWTDITTPFPIGHGGAGLAELLSNGDVLVHAGGDDASAEWFELTPDGAGDYTRGTWTKIENDMNVGRLFFTSDMLPDGRYFVAGGEYINEDGTTVEADTNTAEIFNPVDNTWFETSPNPLPMEGDTPSEVLPDGNVLVGDILDNGTEIYDPTTNAWSTGPAKLYADEVSDEENWVKLPGGKILTYDIYTSIDNSNGTNNPVLGGGGNKAEIFDPTLNGGAGGWEDASNGQLPLLSSVATGFELGPGVLLPDGRVFYTGANGLTAFYNSNTGIWSPGPSIPRGMVQSDSPNAVLPNGDVLMAVSPVEIDEDYHGPTLIYEFNPNTDVYTNVTPSKKTLRTNDNAFTFDMLVLPSGQVMVTNFTNQIAIYTPDGTPNSGWRPTITSVVDNGDGTFTLTGTQLNGLDEGAYYGDDNEMATNYPIVRLIDSNNGRVYYARTFDWSSTNVATGSTPETVKFTLPTALGADPFSTVVIANGIANVATGAATRLVIPADPTPAWVLGTVPTIHVDVMDAFGNILHSDTSTGSVSIATGPADGQFLFSKTTAHAKNGIIAFSSLALSEPGIYTLEVSDGGLTAGISGNLRVVPLPGVQPINYNGAGLGNVFLFLQERRIALKLSRIGPPK